MVVLGLGDPHGGVEIVVGQGRVQDIVAMVLQVGRLQAASRGGRGVAWKIPISLGRWADKCRNSGDVFRGKNDVRRIDFNGLTAICLSDLELLSFAFRLNARLD